jgi:hypothetical protein
LGVAALDSDLRNDLLEIIDDRSGTRATIVTSQLPVEHWHAWIGDQTIADATLDRLLSRSHRIQLRGNRYARVNHSRPIKEVQKQKINPSIYTHNRATSRIDKRGHDPGFGGHHHRNAH